MDRTESSPSSKLVVVSGATGKQGGSVIEALLKANENTIAEGQGPLSTGRSTWSIRALTRNPKSSKVCTCCIYFDYASYPYADLND